LSVALVLTALVRANLAIFWCSQRETIGTFELVSIVGLAPAALAAWTMTWYRWFRLDELAWIPRAAIALTLVYAVCDVAAWDRYLFLALLAFSVCRGLRKGGVHASIVLPALLLISIGQFARELAATGIRTIWFPFGAGVARQSAAPGRQP
jgi:hypothetical protein